MCGRFGLFAQPSAIEERFDATFTYDYEPRYNVAPEGPGLAAVRNASPGAIDRLRWGLLPHWVDDPDDFPTLINARAETAADKPAFRDAFARRRCLVPASTFFEWTGPAGGRVPHAIGVDGEPLFAMAGLWETWGEGDDAVRSATILTTDANDVVAELHDRMPVILDREEERTWLEADDADELEGLLDPFPAGRTEAHEVSRAVNDPSNDGPSLVEPVGHDQSGLGEFV
jgi:putative SOS response-associated peptidase YedK